MTNHEFKVLILFSCKKKEYKIKQSKKKKEKKRITIEKLWTNLPLY